MISKYTHERVIVLSERKGLTHAEFKNIFIFCLNLNASEHPLVL